MRELLKCICKSKEGEFNLYRIIKVFDFWGLFEAYLHCTNYEDFLILNCKPLQD